MLCSPSEPKQLKKLGKVSSVPERYGADFLIMGKRTRIGVQRKQFPGDLLASLNDNRLYEQLPKLSGLDQALLIVEGRGRWTEDGELIADKYHSFTKQQLHGLLFTIMFEFGVPSIIVDGMEGTALVLTHLEAWVKKAKHTSLKSRKGPDKTTWGTTTEHHMAQHIVQGFPGVGQELAGRIVDKFEGVPLTWTVDIDEMMTVEGVGKKKAGGMYHALDTVRHDGDKMKSRLKIGVLTRLKYQSLSDAKKKPYEDIVAKHGYTMFDLYQLEVTRRTVKLWIFRADPKRHQYYEIKEFSR